MDELDSFLDVETEDEEKVVVSGDDDNRRVLPERELRLFELVGGARGGSAILHRNRTLIIDILLEVQALFRECTVIQGKFDKLVPATDHLTSSSFAATMTSNEGDEGNEDQARSASSHIEPSALPLLRKTLRYLDRHPLGSKHVTRRLQWALVKHSKFEALIEKLIDYNAAVEALLDSSTMQQLQKMQEKTYMALLQLNEGVKELREIAKAAQVKGSHADSDVGRLEVEESYAKNDGSSRVNIARLAEFKATQVELETKPFSAASLEPVPLENLRFIGDPAAEDAVRSEAVYKGTQRVWIEWKRYDRDHSSADSKWNRIIEDRIKKLTLLLSSTDKPPQFNAPQCTGYFHDAARDRYGLLYLKPDEVSPEARPIPLLHIIESYRQTVRPIPSLTKRVQVAYTIARCLMYFHSVNWLHKGFRSQNIIFFPIKGSDEETAVAHQPDLAHPFIAGFEYARPDLPEEVTEPPPEHSEHDVYRHPDIIGRKTSRSQKCHDIYSLGVVLVEIAYWKPMNEIMEIPRERKAAKSRVKRVKKLLLNEGYLDTVASTMGDAYSGAVKKCLILGDEEASVLKHTSQINRDVGFSIEENFAEQVVQKLGGLRI